MELGMAHKLLLSKVVHILLGEEEANIMVAAAVEGIREVAVAVTGDLVGGGGVEVGLVTGAVAPSVVVVVVLTEWVALVPVWVV